MQVSIEQLLPDDPNWQHLYKKLKATDTLTALVLTAWQIGLWVARVLVEQQLAERAQIHTQWKCCSVCGARLTSKGFVKRQMLTLIGKVKWKRRVGRCPHQCFGSQQVPFDVVLGINPYQQTSTELIRLGCLLAVFLPFEVAAWMMQQLTGITVSDDTIWNWVQVAGQNAMEQLAIQIQHLVDGESPKLEPLDVKASKL